MNIVLCGCNGQMGAAVTRAADESGKCTIVAGIDRSPGKRQNAYPVFSKFEELESLAATPDAIIDFSHPFYLPGLLDYAKTKAIPVVLATTGYSEKDDSLINEAQKFIPMIYYHNTSRGVHVLLRLAQMAAQLMEDADIELIEKHSRNKLDSPSGTSSMILKALGEASGKDVEAVFGRKGRNKARNREEIGVHSIRAGGNKSEHSLSFTNMGEMLEIRHTTFSYEIFALGAIDAARFLMGKKPGTYDFGQVVG